MRMTCSITLCSAIVRRVRPSHFPWSAVPASTRQVAGSGGFCRFLHTSCSTPAPGQAASTRHSSFTLMDPQDAILRSSSLIFGRDVAAEGDAAPSDVFDGLSDEGAVTAAPQSAKLPSVFRIGTAMSSKKDGKNAATINETLEKVGGMEDPDVIEYPLHTMTDISDVMQRSLRARDNISALAPSADVFSMKRAILLLEDACRVEVPGKALYFRVLPGVRSRILDQLKELLLDYAVHMLEPFPREVCCDVSHYAAHAPVVAVSKTCMKQVLERIDALSQGQSLPEEKLRNVPMQTLQPLSPEEVAREIVARLSEILKASASDAPIDESNRSPEKRIAQVCIGIAPTPVLAKLACDAEFSLIQRQPEQDTVPIRVRSFYQHIRCMSDGKKFMAHFPLTHIPLFTPTFVRVLRDVFGVVTCNDIYRMRERLWFSLSSETFQVCYLCVYGMMKFAGEKEAVLFSPAHLIVSQKPLEAMAQYSISLLERDVNALQLLPTNARFARSKPTRFMNVEARLVYGRLNTDEQFIERVEEVFASATRKLHRVGYQSGGSRVALRCGNKGEVVRTYTYPATTHLSELLSMGRKIGQELAPLRQKKGLEMTGEPFSIHVVMTHLSLASMTPKRLEGEITQLRQEFAEGRKKFNRWRNRRRSQTNTYQLAAKRRRPCVNKTNPMEPVKKEDGSSPQAPRKGSASNSDGDLNISDADVFEV